MPVLNLLSPAHWGKLSASPLLSCSCALAVAALRALSLEPGYSGLAKHILGSLRAISHDTSQQRKLFATAVDSMLLQTFEFAFTGMLPACLCHSLAFTFQS